MPQRKWPPVKVGDTIGAHEVVALLPRDAAGNERVRVRCDCTRESDVYVFNLRSRRPVCTHVRRKKRADLED